MSGDDLTRAVNKAGSEAGLELQYDRTAAAHWLAGSCPLAPVPELVGEVLSRALGRTITNQDTRLIRATTRTAAHEGESPGPADLLTQLGRSGDGRRGSTPVYVLTPAGAPIRPTAFRASWETVPSDEGGVRATMGDAQLDAHRIRLAEDLLTAMHASEETLGGSLVRPALTGFLGTIAPVWLRASGPSRLHRQLLVTTAQLSLLAGFTWFDGQSHGMAQAYYRTAVELAEEAADREVRARALRAMSVQAHYLGHHRHARDLADEAARYGAVLPAREAAYVIAQQAVATADYGDRRRAYEHLAQARRLLDRAPEPTAGASYYGWAAYSHQEAEVLTALGDIPGAIAAFTQSINNRPTPERRARAITTAKTAELLISVGHLDRACATWHSLLDDYPLLGSGRLGAATAAMTSHLSRYASHPPARALLARAAGLGIPTQPQATHRTTRKPPTGPGTGGLSQ